MEFREVTFIYCSFIVIICISCTNCATTTTTTKYSESSSSLSNNNKNKNEVLTKPVPSSVPPSPSTTAFATPRALGDTAQFSTTVKKQLKNSQYLKRQPKFGLNFTMPGLTMQSIDTDTFLGPTGIFGGTNSDKTGSNMMGDLATIAAPILILKGVSIAAVKALKTIILPPIFFLVLLAFLIAGAAFFIAALVNGQGFSNPFTGLTNAFNRNTYEFEQPIYNALDNAYQKYGQQQYYTGSSSNTNYNPDKGTFLNSIVASEPDYTTYQYQPYTSTYSTYHIPKKSMKSK